MNFSKLFIELINIILPLLWRKHHRTVWWEHWWKL